MLVPIGRPVTPQGFVVRDTPEESRIKGYIEVFGFLFLAGEQLFGQGG